MTPIVDIIADVVAAMKPDLSDCTPSVASQVVTWTSEDRITHLLFEGERVKVKDGSADSGWHYGTVTQITNDYIFEVTFTDLTDESVGTPYVILNYQYGHGQEIVNTLLEMTKNATYKRDMFPCVCLIQDFPEEHTAGGYEVEATLNVVICTDSKQSYKAPDRYTYTIEPILYPLVDLFIDRMIHSHDLVIGNYRKTDRLAWGKAGLYGNTANIFNDFVDAVELENLKVNIFKTCE